MAMTPAPGRVVQVTHEERRALLASIDMEHRYVDPSTGDVRVYRPGDDPRDGPIVVFRAVKNVDGNAIDFFVLDEREQRGPDIPGRNEWRRCAAEQHLALEALVQLQLHYAELLNMHDGGARHAFASAEEWIARLREMEQEEAER